MRHSQFSSKTVFILLSILIYLPILNAQNYKFNNYGVKDGICDPYIYSIQQDKNGFIWLGTGEGLCRFNGFEFTGVEDTLNNSLVSSSYTDSDGNLWFGYNDGKVGVYDGLTFNNFVNTDFSSKIVAFEELGDDLLIVSQASGIAIPDEDNLKIVTAGIDNLFLSTLYAYDDNLLIGSMDGLSVFKMEKDSFTLVKKISELDYINVQSIAGSEGSNKLFIGTEDDGLHILTLNNENYSIEKTRIKELEYENISALLIDNSNNLWVATYSGVFKVDLDDELNSYIHFDESNGLSEKYTRALFQDKEFNVWIGSYGSGIDLKLDDAFIFYGDENITAVGSNDDRIFLGKEGEVDIFEKSTNNFIESVELNIGNESITSLCYFDDELWIGTESSGVFIYNLTGKKTRSLGHSNSSLGKSINHILSKGEYIWLATFEGIYKISKSDYSIQHLTTQDGLPHNTIYHLFVDNNGLIWISTKSNSFYTIRDENIEVHELPFQMGEIDFRSIYVSENEDIWAITYGTGVFRIHNDSLAILNANSGLKSNFCYSIEGDGNGAIWIGHRFGISRINPATEQIQTFGPEEGFVGDCNLNAVNKDENGVIQFGTTQGFFTYNYLEDQVNTVPPMLNVTNVYLNDQPVEVSDLNVLPYGIYKLRIEYIGLNYTAPSNVKYQYMFEGKGFDEDYNPPTSSRVVIYNNIRDGNYTFQLKSVNNAGISNDKPLQIQMRVKLPFWKTWWFIVFAVVLIAISIFSIIRIRERKQKLLQEFLEKELDARTKEVVEQKEEIEVKNRDITDSINYAQRIQASILPSIKTLQDSFTGSFVFYAPRDIVSGDFYWFDRISDSRFVIVCADSTGHGVPGAFMSMIGTTLIKDICFRSDVKSPAAILSNLDEQLNNTLNQNVEAEKSNDGMDIIVCEIDLETYKLRVASAMRPMIIYKDGKEIYLKGSRSSIGGNLEIDEKDFEENSIQLSKGDQIYMFSDGYPDQFGGPMGKKFKMVRLKNMLKDIYQKPMDDQFNQIKSTFQLWKNEYPQVDDVLFMGIRI